MTRAIQANAIQDLNYLPTNLTFINLARNKLEQISNLDWRHVTFIRLSTNPLTTFAFVKLSSDLEYFNCNDCALTNITLDLASFEALNSLSPWDGNENADTITGYAINKRVSTDTSKCNSIGGIIKPLWAASSKYSITACVIVPTTTLPPPTTIVPTTHSPDPINNTAMIVGISVGVVGVIGIAGALVILRRRQIRSELDTLQTNFGNTDPSLGTNYYAMNPDHPDNFHPSAPYKT
ncbi:hypothetical protein THRCLA_11366 [Thraustotheca clavata]|uniref:Uncharacterized protein n=1 Tax=Thraustotheca clavata TaxID=74557 RepID=A0A1V9Y7X8_9STRA|nr:hypothetical protein THRCLA_11366 [Thraustotheca clavata]